MLPGTLVYVNAGKELAQIDSLSGILSPGLLISFALLGLFPIGVKKMLAVYKRKFKKTPESTEVKNMKSPNPLKGGTNVK